MKSFTFLALAAGVSATGFRQFPPFTCPDNTDNKCTDKQTKGFDFSDLDFGSFKQYNDFEWRGFTCETDDNDKRDRLGRRTGKKHIGGTCGPQKSGSPSFGVGKNIDRFSLHEIHVKPEFDCDLEFHYDMPDGKTCKHRSPCSKKGTKVPNTQCGGAKNVTIIYPPQPNKPKPNCSIKIPTISFGCNPPKSTKPPTSKPTTSTVETTTKGVSSTTSTTKSVETTPPTPPISKSTTTAVVSSSSTTVTTKGSSSSTTTTKGVETTPPASSTVITTSFLSTSTVVSTIVSTITSCPPNVPNCPNGGVTTTTNIVIVSTTICPVTQTTTVSHPPTETKPTEKPTTDKSTTEKPQQSTSTAVPTTTTSSPPEPTLPCPDVVPKCLNTFMFTLGCKDNTDHACYCPDELFVKNIFTCLYAHGESDTIISEAVIFFQGICAPYVPQNPCIATGATVTSYVTPTQTVTVPAVYTTITVVATTVVPCTSDGVEVTGSSTTTTINTTLTVPQVGFQTDNNDNVGVIPVTTPPVVQQPPRTTVAPPTGTGVIVRPTASNIVTVNAGGRVGAGFGLAGFVAMAVVAAL